MLEVYDRSGMAKHGGGAGRRTVLQNMVDKRRPGYACAKFILGKIDSSNPGMKSEDWENDPESFDQ